MSLETQKRIDQNRVILGGSSPVIPGEGTLADRYMFHTKEHLEPIVNDKHVVLILYARPAMDGQARGIDGVLKGMGARSSISTHDHPGSEKSVVRDAEALYIDGGSTGRLVANLHGLRDYNGSLVDNRPDASQTSLIDEIRSKVADGFPIVGFSAGLNVMAYDTRTTNDMAAAVQVTPAGLVARLDALRLFPAKLSFNPHFPQKAEDKTEYIGENRAERIAPVLEMDPERKVLALREGAYILVNGMEMKLEGTMGGVLFEYGKEPEELTNGDLSYLLNQSGE